MVAMSVVRPATRPIDKAVVRQLERAVGEEAVLWRPEEVLAFEYDGTIERAMPQAVAFPDSAQQVASVVKIALEAGLPVVPRGAGTGLSGGAVAALGGVVVALTRMKRILEIMLRTGWPWWSPAWSTSICRRPWNHMGCITRLTHRVSEPARSAVT